MNIAVLGTGLVGVTIGTKLTQLGHNVMMGSRTHDNPKAALWVSSAGSHASQGTFAEAAAFGEIVFNCTAGMHSLEVLNQAGSDFLAGKILIDVANTLDFSNGFPPFLAVSNTDSLGEQIQEAFPMTRVVKALNTMNCQIMVNPALVPGNHSVFMGGNDVEAKSAVSNLLTQFGWKEENIMDLGDITAARGMEMILPIWLRIFGTLQNPNFNFHIATGPKPA